MEYLLIWIISGTVWGIIWGCVVNSVIQNKGYKENWFWWGFFFGFFALIVALTKPSVSVNEETGKTEIEKKEIKYEILNSGKSKTKVDVYSATHIVSWDIEKDNNSKLYLSIDFLNVSEKTISAIMFSVIGFNSFGDKVIINQMEEFDVLQQDLCIKPGNRGRAQSALPNNDIRKVDISVKKICFSDGSIQENLSSKWVETNQSILDSKYIDCVKSKNAKGKYFSIEDDEYWQCVCGFVNMGNICKCCNMTKSNALQYTEQNIENTYKNYLENIEEQKRIEAEKKLEEKRKQDEECERIKKLEIEKQEKLKVIKKRIIIAIVIFVIIALVVLGIIFIPQIIKYNTAKKYMENGECQKAIEIFTELEDFSDSRSLLDECKNEIQYQEAITLAEQKEYQQAIAHLKPIKDYKDASELIVAYEEAKVYEEKLGIYNEANEFRANEQYDKAIALYLSILDFEDVSAEINTVYLEYGNYLYNAQKYMDAITYYEKVGYNGDEYKESCYLLALEYIEDEQYSLALSSLDKIESYKDSSDYRELCKKEIKKYQDYMYAIREMGDGNCYTALEVLYSLPIDYLEVREKIEWCNRYKDILGHWECTGYQGGSGWIDDEEKTQHHDLHIWIDSAGTVWIKEDDDWDTGTISGRIVIWEDGDLKLNTSTGIQSYEFNNRIVYSRNATYTKVEE